MRNAIRLSILLAGVFVSLVGSSQQDLGYTQFTWDQLVINPAYSGSKDALSARMFYRTQWVGVDGAPSTQSLSFHSPLFNDKMGAGFTVIHDQIGVSRNLVARGSAAYKLSLPSGVLSLGLSGQYRNQANGWDQVSAMNPGDEALPLAATQSGAFNAGAGVYYQSQHFYAGLAVPTLLENATETTPQERHYYAMTGAVMRLSRNLRLRTSGMVRYLENAPMQVDVQASVILREQIFAGLGYRHGDSFSVMMQYQFAEQWMFGYAYDYTTSAMRSNLGSHEVFLGFDLKRARDGYYNPRFF